MNIMRQPPSLVINRVKVYNFVAFFDRTPVGRASDEGSGLKAYNQIGRGSILWFVQLNQGYTNRFLRFRVGCFFLAVDL